MLPTPQTYRTLLLYSRRKVRRPEDAEDFAAWAIVKLLEGFHNKSSKKQLWDQFGRDVLGKQPRSLEQFDEELHAAPAPAPPLDKNYWRLLDGEERAIIALQCVWGFNLAEIGDLFGVGEARICQRRKKILKKLFAGAAKC